MNKANECDRLAKEATDPNDCARYQAEAKAWQDIADDIAKGKGGRFT